MLNPKAIEDFFGRQLADYDWMKTQSREQLDRELSSLEPPFPSDQGTQLWLHQKVCLLLLLELRRFMLFLDMGGGKTNITLQLLRYRKQRGETPKAVVFVPYITSVETWVEETTKHAPDLVCAPLVSSTESNATRLAAGEGDLFVLCYQSAVAMLADKNGPEWSMNSETVRNHFQGFDTLVLDEIHKCKSIRSLTYRMCRGLAAQCTWCLGLTGTPFGRDLQDLWPQFHLVDFGDTLGKTFGLYRAAFFSQKINYWGGYEYTFQKRKLPELKRIIKNASISYTVDEFADMPSKEYIKKTLSCPVDAKAYCKRAMNELWAGQKDKSYQQINNSYLQLRQLASGFMTFKGEDNAKIQVAFDENAKLDALDELMDGIPPDAKVVIYHHFVYTSKIISDKLKSLSIRHARIWGGQKDPIAELRRFKDDPDVRVLVINWKSGSSSLNLQTANYMIVFEQPESPIDRKQGEARIWRPGQNRRVFIYDLLMRDTVDERLHKANEEGRDLLKELLDGRTG